MDKRKENITQGEKGTKEYQNLRASLREQIARVKISVDIPS